jgi:hypothetical protein
MREPGCRRTAWWWPHHVSEDRREHQWLPWPARREECGACWNAVKSSGVEEGVWSIRSEIAVLMLDEKSGCDERRIVVFRLESTIYMWDEK